MMKHALLLSLVAVGCADAPVEPPPPPYPTTTYGGKTGDDMQGLYILGSAPDELFANGRHFRVSATPANRPNYTLSVKAAGPNGVNGANLVASGGSAPHEGDDGWFTGMVLDGVGGGQVLILSAAPATLADGATATTSTAYVLKYRSSSNEPWDQDYCEGGAGAIPLQGYYDGARLHGNSSDITFGCTDGIAFKCEVYWGYVAGNAGAGTVGWDYHQACTAMGNANYCGTGEVFTREQTPVVIEDIKPNYAMPDPDLEHPDPMPGDLDTYYFEAAWRAFGLPPVCLSKTRWAALPPSPCAGLLPDPRISGSPGQFCDDMTLDDIKSAGGIVINGSKLMDAPLRVWRSSATLEYVSTIRGYYDVVTPTASVAPFTGYDSYVAVNSMLLRNLPGTLDADLDMIALYVHTATSPTSGAVIDTVISTAAALPNHTLGAFEGYAFKDPTKVPGLRRLVLYRKGSDYITLAGAPPSGFLPVPNQPFLGYAMPPP